MRQNKQVKTAHLSLKSQSSHTQSPTRWNILSVVVLLVAFAMLLQAYSLQHKANPRKALVTAQTPFALNEQISQGNSIMSVTNVSYSQGVGAFVAPEGTQYAIVTITITNMSDTPISVLPANDIYLKDAVGNVAYIAPYALDQPFRAGDVLPSETIKGELSFLVKKDVDYKLYIDSIWSGGVAPFKLK